MFGKSHGCLSIGCLVMPNSVRDAPRRWGTCQPGISWVTFWASRSPIPIMHPSPTTMTHGQPPIMSRSRSHCSHHPLHFMPLVLPRGRWSGKTHLQKNLPHVLLRFTSKTVDFQRCPEPGRSAKSARQMAGWKGDSDLFPYRSIDPEAAK